MNFNEQPPVLKRGLREAGRFLGRKPSDLLREGTVERFKNSFLVTIPVANAPKLNIVVATGTMATFVRIEHEGTHRNLYERWY